MRSNVVQFVIENNSNGRNFENQSFSSANCKLQDNHNTLDSIMNKTPRKSGISGGDILQYSEINYCENER
jgi:hypothetical protein